MILDDAYEQFSKAAEEALEWITKEVSGLRSGRVSPEAVNNVPVEHYGTRTPLQGMATISLSDARTIVISPWDATAIPSIEHALNEAQLGAQPVVDGRIIRLVFASLTEEVREETVKILHRKAEEARVRLRQARDESLSLLKKARENSDITEDDFYDGRKELDSRIDAANAEIERIVEKKESDIRTL